MKIGKLELGIVNGHFISNDGCRQNLEESPIQLQRNEDSVFRNIIFTAFDSGPCQRRVNLLYLNITIADSFFACHQELPVKCPVCGETYVIKKQDYDSLKAASHSE